MLRKTVLFGQGHYLPYSYNYNKQCFIWAEKLVRTARNIFIKSFALFALSRSQWPRGLRRRSATACLLRLWFRITPEAWMFVCCECCVLSDRGLCDELITRPEESYRMWCVVVCDLETSWMRRPWPIGGCCTKKNTLRINVWRLARNLWNVGDNYVTRYALWLIWKNKGCGNGLFQGTAHHLSGWTDRKNKIAFTAVYIDQNSNRLPSQYKPQTVLLEATCLVYSYVLRVIIYMLNVTL